MLRETHFIRVASCVRLSLRCLSVFRPRRVAGVGRLCERERALRICTDSLLCSGGPLQIASHRTPSHSFASNRIANPKAQSVLANHRASPWIAFCYATTIIALLFAYTSTTLRPPKHTWVQFHIFFSHPWLLLLHQPHSHLKQNGIRCAWCHLRLNASSRHDLPLPQSS